MSLLPGKAQELVEQLGLVPHPEGGFFLETFRSGSVPMTSRGLTNYEVKDPSNDLIDTKRKTDGDSRRNPLTSIYWVPTVESPNLQLVVQKSDHVRLYHGGRPMKFYLYDPKTKTLDTKILGPDIVNGHVLQFGVPHGVIHGGHLIEHAALNDFDYCVLAEVFGPGFDVCDFAWGTAEMLGDCPPEIRAQLDPLLNPNAAMTASKEETRQDFDRFYDDDKK